ncbi:transglutaminase-like cysteine peptidase [Bradyrhizobium sp. Arg816]|uniref:transglutaminase-like cysteine peptidase n=1 Tax=Bradyrhizobium sp. Arg816 TaxID=2998491 RepID=UPI00249F35B7|nr:transglutaminase-like cysteine peptidase [Bradyrhizobium sp. Arg816]MDI3566432.1 transglutaminase-like cysteine peptidase [Bradyrhizobium sp. Arg816]
MKTLVALSFFVLGSASAFAAPVEQENRSSATIIGEARNVLAPIQFVKFCMNYPSECEARTSEEPTLSRDDAFAALEEVNTRVNRSIAPTVKSNAPLAARWTIGPAAGDCNDYAVTKRHELLAKGWRSSDLRLAVVFAPEGGHLILVARVKDGDYVLDNLSEVVRPWNETSYAWVSIESTVNPKFWVAVDGKGQTGSAQKSASLD